ncbi:MAG: M15 family metallopeptidase [Candidatus Shapirobacteria bacterium]
MNKDAIVLMQRRIGAVPDGFWGPRSIAACQRHLRAILPVPSPWPTSDQPSLTAFYGKPGDERQLVDLPAPCPLLYEGKAVKTIRCHRLVAASLESALRAAYAVAPEVAAIYDGCYNNRPMRGGSLPSLHARGAAIDLDAAHNGNKVSWPASAMMPLRVMECFAEEGWISAGAFWARDAMHFQATR